MKNGRVKRCQTFVLRIYRIHIINLSLDTISYYGVQVPVHLRKETIYSLRTVFGYSLTKGIFFFLVHLEVVMEQPRFWFKELQKTFFHLRRKGDRNSFYDFIDLYIKNPPEKLEENTIKKYVTCLNHLKAFRKQLFFADIDNLLIRDFHKHMQTELNLQGAACKKYMEAFKKVIHQARKENYSSC